MSDKTGKNILLALTSGLLLGLPWSVPALFFVVFLAWLPLLLLEEKVRFQKNSYAIFNYAFVSFLLWNILATWWIAKVQFVGAIPVSYTHLTLPTTRQRCRSRWSADP
mgnify:CR=1 FL=1